MRLDDIRFIVTSRQLNEHFLRRGLDVGEVGERAGAFHKCMQRGTDAALHGKTHQPRQRGRPGQPHVYRQGNATCAAVPLPVEHSLGIKAELRHHVDLCAGALRKCLLGEQRVPQQAGPDHFMTLGVAGHAYTGHAAVHRGAAGQHIQRAGKRTRRRVAVARNEQDLFNTGAIQLRQRMAQLALAMQRAGRDVRACLQA